MEFGMPTLAELPGLDENARLCGELGFSFLELNMNFPPYQIERLRDVAQLRAAAARYGIYYTIHLDENMNVCDFNRAVAAAYLDTVRQCIEVARALGVPLINMHLHKGVYVTLPDRKMYLFEQYREEYWESIRHFRALCEQWVGDGSVRIAIENTGGFAPFEREAIEFLLSSPVFVLTWDIGHSHAARAADEAFILQNEQKLAHFHIHDAVGTQNHLPLGTGEIDLAARLRMAARGGCRCVIETKTAAALRQSARWLREQGEWS